MQNRVLDTNRIRRPLPECGSSRQQPGRRCALDQKVSACESLLESVHFQDPRFAGRRHNPCEIRPRYQIAQYGFAELEAKQMIDLQIENAFVVQQRRTGARKNRRACIAEAAWDACTQIGIQIRSEEHTSELQSL